MWKVLSEDKALSEIKAKSIEQPVLIFKHSTRCGLSAMAKNRIERNWKSEDASKIQPYILDLIRFRSVSQAIADEFKVHHQSPQILLISKGECIYDASHMEIDYSNILNKVAV